MMKTKTLDEVSQLFEDCTCDGINLCAHCKTLRGGVSMQPRTQPSMQCSLASNDITAVNRVLPLASDDELDHLINKLESMRLELYLRHRKEAEERLESLRDELKQEAWNGGGIDQLTRLYELMSDEHRIYRECSRAINEMIKRGVAP